MPIINLQYRTITCDKCGKTITFEATNGLLADVVEANPWLKTNRAVQTADSRVFSYCSDVCEIENVGTGIHNAPEPKQVQQPTGGATAIAQAAAEARRRQLANDAIKNGEPIKVALS